MNENVTALLGEVKKVMGDAVAVIAAANARITALETAGRELLLIADKFDDDLEDGCRVSARCSEQLRALDDVINDGHATVEDEAEAKETTATVSEELAHLVQQMRDARTKLESSQTASPRRAA